MKTKKKKIGNVGIRLSIKEPNLLENYIHYRRRKSKKKKKKKKKRSKKIKRINIQPKIDLIDKIINDSKIHKDKKEIEIKEINTSQIPDTTKNNSQIKTIHVNNIEVEGNKKGSGIQIV